MKAYKQRKSPDIICNREVTTCWEKTFKQLHFHCWPCDTDYFLLNISKMEYKGIYREKWSTGNVEKSQLKDYNVTSFIGENENFWIRKWTIKLSIIADKLMSNVLSLETPVWK